MGWYWLGAAVVHVVGIWIVGRLLFPKPKEYNPAGVFTDLLNYNRRSAREGN